MSGTEATEDRPHLDFAGYGDVAFGDLMDALDPQEEGEAGGGGEGDPAGAGAADPTSVAGSTDAGSRRDAAAERPAAGTPAGDAAPDAGDAGPAAGDAGQPAAPSGAAADGFDPKTVLSELGELSTKVEENLTKAYQQQAYEQAEQDYGRYFEALRKHPRLLVGTEVPAIGVEGMETLRNSEDAKEWQEAVRSLLVEEIQSQAQQKLGENRDFLETVHASIDLFKNNPDLIPGARGFNRELADTFATMVTPYEIRVDGKLQGYSIPVQGIVDNLRKQLAARKPAAPAAAPASKPAPKKAAPPQAGIQSRAGSSGEREDFSTLFGTIGLPNLQI